MQALRFVLFFGSIGGANDSTTPSEIVLLILLFDQTGGFNRRG
jgi:hypothetical protein